MGFAEYFLLYANRYGSIQSNTAEQVSPILENLVSSWMFTAAQQILSDSATASLPASVFQEGLDNNSSAKLLTHTGKQQETKQRTVDSKPNLYPARTSSLSGRRSGSVEPPWANLSAASQTVFDSTPTDSGPRSARERSTKEKIDSIYNHNLEQLAAYRAELYLLQRRVLEQRGSVLGWTVGWSAILKQHPEKQNSLSEVSLEEEGDQHEHDEPKEIGPQGSGVKGLHAPALALAMESLESFRKLYTVSDCQCRVLLKKDD